MSAKQLQQTTQGFTDAAEIMTRSVALIVTFRGIGNRRKIDSETLELKANANGAGTTDMSWVNATKKLFEAEEYDKIQKLDTKARNYLLDKCALILKDGVYLMPGDFVSEITRQLKDFGAERIELVDAFVSKYDSHLNESKKRLGPLHDPSDYQSPDSIRAAFRIDWRFIEWSTPKALRSMVSAEVYAEEMRKAKADAERMCKDVEQALCVSMRELFDHLVDRLTPDANGKKKTFRDTLLTYPQEFFATFGSRNITNSESLAEIAENARKLIEGIDAQTLRDSKSVRENVREGFQKISAEIETMLVQQPKRNISFDEI